MDKKTKRLQTTFNILLILSFILILLGCILYTIRYIFWLIAFICIGIFSFLSIKLSKNEDKTINYSAKSTLSKDYFKEYLFKPAIKNAKENFMYNIINSPDSEFSFFAMINEKENIELVISNNIRCKIILYIEIPDYNFFYDNFIIKEE